MFCGRTQKESCLVKAPASAGDECIEVYKRTGRHNKECALCSCWETIDAAPHVMHRSGVTFNTFDRGRTWEADEPNSLVSGCVRAKSAHKLEIERTDSEINQVINTIKQQVGLLPCNPHKLEPCPRPPIVKPAADSRTEALNYLDISTNLSASPVQKLNKVVVLGLHQKTKKSKYVGRESKFISRQHTSHGIPVASLHA